MPPAPSIGMQQMHVTSNVLNDPSKLLHQFYLSQCCYTSQNVFERHARSRMSLGFEMNQRAPLLVSFKPYVLLTCYFNWGDALAKAKEGQKESRKKIL